MKVLESSNRSSLLKISLRLLLLVFLSDSVIASDTDSLFKSDDIINMELRTDFSAIRIDTIGEPQYHDGELIYYSADGSSEKFSVKVRIRGNFRRKPENCSFPPVMVNFKKDEVKNTLFDNQDKLKLVTPCQNEEDVFSEYTIYKMYNLVTDKSLKVRLVKMLYFDTGRGKKVFEKHSFFIEDEKGVMDRNESIGLDNFISPFDLDRENVKRMTIFQFIIGNKDWIFTSGHNLIFMQPADTANLPYVVPYDFDFAAFVSANYTKQPGVPEYLQPERRVYKGLCFTEEEFRDVFEFYRQLRTEFEALINNMSFLSKMTRKEKIKYIDYFYKVIDNKELIKKEFLDVCQTKDDFKIIDLLNKVI